MTGPETIAPPAIRLRGISKNFGAVRAVHNVSLTTGQGEIVAFPGPNGASCCSGSTTPTAPSPPGMAMSPPNGWWAVNVVAWLVIFAGGAVSRFRMDTARV